MTSKLGKSGRDIFASTTRPALMDVTVAAHDVPIAPMAAPTAPVAPAAVPTPVVTEPYTKATVVLRNRQIAFLDRVALDIRSTTGAAIARAELIRAMVDAVAESGIDMTAATSEADLKRMFAGRLMRSPLTEG